MGIFNKIKKILKKDNIETNVDDKKKIKESILSPQENIKPDEAPVEPIQESKIIPEKSSKVSQEFTNSNNKKNVYDSDDKIESKLNKTLSKTREGFFNKMKFFFSGKNKVDSDFLDHLEEMLITCDIGVGTTIKIIDLVEKYISKHKYLHQDEVKTILKEQIKNLLDVNEPHLSDSKTKPYVILFVGVNGVGKTTTIAKLANLLKNKGNKVLIGAADTFRAAAIEQIDLWAKKINIPIVKQKMGSDPAAVTYDTIQSAISNDFDYVIIDTAGRLHNKINLMSELEKISSTVKKITNFPPNEVVLALDASTGQNALEQAKQFLKSTNVTHLALTKLDGTAKGGVVISICDQLNIPIKYIGVGENVEDLQLFDKSKFVESLFN